MREIKKVMLKLARENTGTHMLDSGGNDGRGFQKAQKQTDTQILEKPEKYGDEQQHVNVFKYLIEYLEITPESEILNKDFKKFMDSREDAHYLADMEEYAEFQNEPDNYLCEETKATNTYNYENVLSEVLQYVIFHRKEEYYIILQIHRGADVRGGYTIPQIFKLNDADGFLIGQTPEDEE